MRLINLKDVMDEDIVKIAECNKVAGLGEGIAVRFVVDYREEEG